MKRNISPLALAVLVVVIFCARGQAQNYFTIAGNWNNAASWSGGVPVDGQDVVIQANVTLTNSTALLASYTLNSGRTHTFRETNTALRAASITVNGSITHDANTATADPWPASNRVWIICSNLTINSGALIDVNYKGYLGGAGPGRGVDTGGGWYSGGSHGGKGGGGGDSRVYGVAEAPSKPGSGGGRSSPLAQKQGGGWVTVEATGLVTIDGTIRANGGDGGTGGDGTGAGSGGAIFITCRAVAGAGAVTAAGGYTQNSLNQGGGGGGRIAIVYDTGAQAAQNLVAKPTFNLQANQGRASTIFPGYPGSPGTVHLSDSSFWPRTTIFGGAQIVIPGFTSWSIDRLVIQNGSAVFPGGFDLVVSNDVVLSGYGGLWASNSSVRIGGSIVRSNVTVSGSCSGFAGGPSSHIEIGGDVQMDYGVFEMRSISTSILTVAVGGDLLLTNNCRFYLYGGVTNATAGDTGLYLKVEGTMIVSSNAWVYPYADSANGGAPLMEVESLEVAAGSGIDANTNGYTSNYGPGSGAAMGGGWYGGGGYGGKGGGGVYGGATYGNSNAPVRAGSGPGRPAGTIRGGGVIWIRAHNLVTLNGILRANGTDGNTAGDGGTAGGSIYLYCRRLAGTPSTFTANGGGHPSSSGASGGGGRIAIWRAFDRSDTSAWTVTANGGTHATRPGEPGTIVWIKIPVGRTVFSLR